MNNFITLSKNINIYDYTKENMIKSFKINEGVIQDFCINKNGKVFASGDSNGNIQIIQIENLNQVLQIKNDNCQISCIQFSQDSTQLAYGNKEGGVFINDLKVNRKIFQIKEKYSDITQINFPSIQDLLIASNSNGEIMLYSIQQQKKIEDYKNKNFLSFWTLNSSYLKPHLFAAGDSDGLIHVFDLNKQYLDPYQFKPHLNTCSMLRFSQTNPNILYSCGFDERFLIHDLRTKQILNEIKADAPLTSFELVNQEQDVLIGDYYGSISYYSIEELQLLQQYTGDQKAVLKIQKINSKEKISIQQNKLLNSQQQTQKQNQQIDNNNLHKSWFNIQGIKDPIIKQKKILQQVLPNQSIITQNNNQQNIWQEINDLKVFIIKEMENQRQEILKLLKEQKNI